MLASFWCLSALLPVSFSVPWDVPHTCAHQTLCGSAACTFLFQYGFIISGDVDDLSEERD